MRLFLKLPDPRTVLPYEQAVTAKRGTRIVEYPKTLPAAVWAHIDAEMPSGMSAGGGGSRRLPIQH